MRNDRRIDVMVEISRRGDSGTVIRMEMTEYKAFIREQSETLGLVEKKEQKKERVTSYQGTMTGVITKDLMDLIMKSKPKSQYMCPRCLNEEFTDVDKYCKICGMPVGKEEVEESGRE